MSPIGRNTENFQKKTFSNDVFLPFSVELSAPLSNTYFIGDTILIEGRVGDKKEYVMIYLESEKDKKEYSSLVKVDSTGKFKFSFTFPKVSGKYYFVIVSGNSFQTTNPESIMLLDPTELSYPEISTGSLSFRPTLVEAPTPYIPLPPHLWATLVLSQ